MGNCWLASPGLFLNAQPMTPAPKQLPVSKRTITARTIGSAGSFSIEITGASTPIIVVDPDTGLPFGFESEIQFMVMPTTDVIVLHYRGGSNIPSQNETHLIVVDINNPSTAFSPDLGTQPLLARQFVNVHPSIDSKLLFIFLISGTSGSTDYKTQHHQIICAEDGEVLCESLDDYVVTTAPSSAMSGIQRGARVTPLRTLEMVNTTLPGNLERETLHVFKDGCALVPPNGDRSIEITGINFNPPNSDMESERVELMNFSLNAIPMAGWKLADAAGHSFSFPANFIFPAGPFSTVSIWTKQNPNPGSPSPNNLFWGRMAPVWNNVSSGDIATLTFPNGSIASTLRYTRENPTLPMMDPPPGPGNGGGSSPTTRKEVFDETFHRLSATTGVKSTVVQAVVEETLDIDASGDIWTMVGFGNGPEGWSGDGAGDGYPLPGAPRYSLIGFFDNKDKPVAADMRAWFFIGSSSSHTIKPNDLPADTTSVILKIGINDDVLTDNAGEFYVRIKYSRKVPINTPALRLGPPESFEPIFVKSRADVGTGIFLNRGDQILISATGTYTPGGVVGGGQTGPDGWTERALRNPAFPLGSGKDARKFALLYRYSDSLYPMYAGAECSDRYYGDSCELRLRINDDTNGGEQGGYEVMVKVRRATT